VVKAGAPCKKLQGISPFIDRRPDSGGRISGEGLTPAAGWWHVWRMQADADPAAPTQPPAEIPDDATELDLRSGGEAAAVEGPDPWEELEQEATKWREMAMRSAAEMDNLRKRTARDREDAIRYANQRLLEELLPVIDNFEMGMQAAGQDPQSMIFIGMEMVRRQLNEFLSSQGVEEIASSGLFDPNLHDAVAEETCSAGEDGRILRVTRRGFRLRDRLLRPASVVVSKQPAAEPQAPTEGVEA